MNLCIDVGNTTIKFGVYENNRIISKFSINTDLNKSEDEIYDQLANLFKNRQIERVDNIILSSVVPLINQPLMGAIKKIFHHSILLIQSGIKTGLSIKVDNPNEIGNDLIADLVGAKNKYQYPVLIADLGTASKVLLIDKNGSFSSCVIMPGLSLSASSLSNKAALLPEISLETPKSIMAKNTMDALNAGLIYGHFDMIKGIIQRYEKELGYPCKHILTGGGAMHLLNVVTSDFIYDENLCLDGLNILIEKNEVKR